MSAKIPEHMQAVQLDAYGGPLTTQQCPVPKPGPGEVLVRMAAAPINPSDLSFLQGTYATQKPLPVIPGIEGSGTVVAVGPGLFPRWLLGRRVACTSSPRAGGTWAEYMLTSASLCIPLQSTVTLEQGAMLVVNPLTALAFLEIAQREKHAAIVNTAAAGALGRMILRLGQRNGIPIICVVRRPEQVEVVRALGADHVLDSGQPDFDARLQTLTHQLNATLSLDAVAGSLTGQLVEAAPFGGTVLVYGALSGELASFHPGKLLFEHKRVIGFYLPNWLAKKNLLQSLQISQRAQRLVGSQLQATVQQRLPLSSAQEAVSVYRSNMSAGKVLLIADPLMMRTV
ncbi:MAG: zinc-binding dehydrogenase [Anaerolineales bacterium]